MGWVLWIWFMLWLCCGCVRGVQVCATYDRRLGAESADRFARHNAGASVCADMTPPGSDG